MKSHIIEAYGVYDLDDSGYAQKPPIAIYPIQAAAQAAIIEGNNSYQAVYSVKILKINDLNYILDKEIDSKSVITSINQSVPSFIVTKIYREYIYERGFDFSKYYLTLENIDLNVFNDNKTHTISKHWLIFDGEKYFLIQSPNAVNVEKIVFSRDLAIKHALSKLSAEEKQLLGL